MPDLDWIAHELKSPLTIIQGFSELLQTPHLPPQTVSEIGAKITKASLRIQRLLNALLSPPHFQETPLLPLLKSCQNELLTLHPNTHITLHASPVSLLIDPNLFEIALLNLLENAVRYSNPPAHISLSLLSQPPHLHLTVEDRGIGIEKEHISRIFERHYSAFSHSRGGMGLGLSIVKRIMELHGGTIEVQSTPGKGSAFTLIFQQKSSSEERCHSPDLSP